MLAVDASPIRIESRTFLPVPENVDSILFDWLLHPDDGSVAGIHVNLTGVFEFRNIIDDVAALPYVELDGNNATIWITSDRRGNRCYAEAFEAFFYLSDDNSLLLQVPIDTWLTAEQNESLRRFADNGDNAVGTRRR